MQKTLCIKNDTSELSVMNRFLEETGEELGLSTAFTMSLNLVLEEAVSNIIFYAYVGQDMKDTVEITLLLEEGMLTVIVKDHGMPFDPTAKEDPDIMLSTEERPIGGLGIFLIRKIMDEIAYRREKGQNIFIMKKRITK